MNGMNMNYFKKIKSFISLSHILTRRTNIQFAFSFISPFKCIYTLYNEDIKFIKYDLKYMYSFISYEDIYINVLENYYIREKQDLNKKLEDKLLIKKDKIKCKKI